MKFRRYLVINTQKDDGLRIAREDGRERPYALYPSYGALFVLAIEILSSLGQGRGSALKGPQCSPESFA
jgi:hypothetical protein